MRAYSQYYIRSTKDQTAFPTVVIVTDENPEGVTITIKDNAPEGSMTSFNLPRMEMIEALEYLLLKIKSR